MEDNVSYLKAGEICLYKGENGQILPADGDSADRYNRWPIGEEKLLRNVSMRNKGFHRKYFKMLNLAFGNQEAFTDADWFREYALIGIGHMDTFMTPEGKTMYKVKSISFDKCTQEEFEKIYQKTLTFLLQRFGWGREFENELLSYS